ncbi:hypothetical protein OSB04_010317 [Centaurea solstitialis]|uniref:Lipoxygenase domain-containing protein n=1 Tax=Centaurea solstitialis TaxID=347529 RepID=A0AA38T7B4_9ASTR|nr:hypothetical protein OSB04_010317 [Centaurea solstitialis]
MVDRNPNSRARGQKGRTMVAATENPKEFDWNCDNDHVGGFRPSFSRQLRSVYCWLLPHRPTIARTKMPDENPTKEEWQSFLNNPQEALDNCFPSDHQTEKVMSTLDVLSSHSPDEQYIGVNVEAAWEADPDINKAFAGFKERLAALETTINSDNENPKLKNRKPEVEGSVAYPYELLKPKSGPGVTRKGVPYSISI